jgi:hypothetical protein
MDAFCSPIQRGRITTLPVDRIVVARPQTARIPARVPAFYYSQVFKYKVLTAIVTYMSQVAGALLRSERLSQP